MTIIAAVIDKADLKSRYALPANPYEISLRFCMERTVMFLEGNDAVDRTTHCMFERRGPNEDRDLELEFRRICDGANFRQARLPFLDIVFGDKRINSSGLQLADLTARPIGLHVLRPHQPNRAFETLRPKLRRSPDGEIGGWGLKVFP